MNEILLSGSTSADLQAAVDNAASGDTIIISEDMQMTDTVIIPEGTDITIQSDADNNWVMSALGSFIRHFTVRGGLILQNITLDGGNIGGGVLISSGRLTVNDGTVIQKCFNSNGGGIFASPYGTMTMNGGVIRENTATGAGAGVMFRQGDFIMTGGEFLGNTANASGGAIQMLGYSTVLITGGSISGNTAGFQGGGIGIPVNTSANISNVIINGNTAKYNGGGLFIQGTATMSDVTISGNTADIRGGGIYSYANGETEITGESYIINNNAPNGGGIYTAAADYNNLATGSETVFRCNWASTAYQPPVDAGTLYPDIQFASTSITDHPLNNFDINYNIGEPIDVCFNVTYDANGGTGSYTGPCTIPGETDTVLPPAATGISRPGYTFTGWNTEPDGSGTSYAPGDANTVTCDVTLYAQWIDEPESFTVTYGANGGSGGFIDSDRQYGAIYTILTASQADISRPGFIFTGWNTQPDGSGTSYAPGEIITITGDVKLYAQWRQIPTQKRLCRTSVTKCRTSIEGQKIWVDNDNADDSRPPSVEIILLRDGEVYKRTNVDSAGDGYFGFCCLPVWKNSGHKYNYQIDEVVPDGYTKTIDGYNVINTLTP